MVSALCVKQVAKNSLFSSGMWGTKAGTEAKGRVVIPCLVPAPAADKIAYSQFSCLKSLPVVGQPPWHIWGQQVPPGQAGGSSGKASSVWLLQSHNHSKGKGKWWVWKQMDEKALLPSLLLVVCKQQAVSSKEKGEKKKSCGFLGCEDAAVT